MSRLAGHDRGGQADFVAQHERNGAQHFDRGDRNENESAAEYSPRRVIVDNFIVGLHFAYVMQENDRTDEQTQIENRPIGSFVAFEPGLQFIFHMYN